MNQQTDTHWLTVLGQLLGSGAAAAFWLTVLVLLILASV
jgi:hypothetical protein